MITDGFMGPFNFLIEKGSHPLPVRARMRLDVMTMSLDVNVLELGWEQAGGVIIQNIDF